MASVEALPEYATALAAYHAAFADELKAMIASLDLGEGARVLDIACGDGTYARWLARHVGESGGIWAADVSSDYLAHAREAALRGPGAARVQLLAARLERLPFRDGSFDLVWCAQSLYSLPDPLDALRRMRRLVRRGGVVAVLEDDTLHQVLLPWPVELELAVRRAELAAFEEESDRPEKFYVGRRLYALAREAGFTDCRRRTWASDRQAPLGAPERAFLHLYLRDLRDRAAPFLEPDPLRALDELIDPGSEAYLLDRPDLTLTVVDHLVRAVR